MSQSFDASKSMSTLDPDSTLIVVIEMSLTKWLVAAMVPGMARQPLKKIDADAEALSQLLCRWRGEATEAGKTLTRVVVTYEAGRDGFWLARWLLARNCEAYVIHASSVAVSREHRRAKTDRLDTELLMRAFLGWLRGEKGHCRMAAVPTVGEEDARRPNRERDSLVRERTRIVNRIKAVLACFGLSGFKPTSRKAADKFSDLLTPEGMSLPENTLGELRRNYARMRMLTEQIHEIERDRLSRLAAAPPTEKSPPAMVRLLARVVGVGVDTADMLVHEILSRGLRDRRAVARYAGLTGAPDESGKRRREKGLARAGNARVRYGMILLAWRFLQFQKQSLLARWFEERTRDGRPGTRKTMIVALARKLLIALWRMVTVGVVPDGVVMRPET